MRRELLDYDASADLAVRQIGGRETDGLRVSQMTFAARPGVRRAAYRVGPIGKGPFPCVLFVHWYEPESHDSNRTQFLDEAKALAKRGVMSLLVEAAWSDREWFLKRTQDDDFEASVEIVVEIRRAMDLLLADSEADASRFVYVGHDFGAMYGVVAGSVDPRPMGYVLMAGTPRFSDWFLYYPPLEGDEREAFIEQMEELDPVERVGSLSPAPILFQFGESDPHVPVPRAEDFFRSAEQPKDVAWYPVGHALNDEARAARIDWLVGRLGLDSG